MHYLTNKSASLDHILSQINPVHIAVPYQIGHDNVDLSFYDTFQYYTPIYA
jgi:hypothetical protein